MRVSVFIFMVSAPKMKSTFLILLNLVGGLVAASNAAFGQSESGPTSIAAVYNDGVALYRDSKYAEAAVMFQQAAAAADSSLAAKARYNLGNTHYARALQNLQPPNQAGQPDTTGQDSSSQDLFAPPGTYQGTSPEMKQAAMEHLESAIAQYRSALRIQPNDSDARANIELANRLIQQLKQEQQQQQGQQQQQDQQQQDQQQPNSDEEQSDAQQSESESEQSESESEQSKSDQSESDQSESEQPESGQSDQPQDQKQADEDASGQSAEQPQASEKPQDSETQDSETQDSQSQPERRDASQQDDSADQPDQGEPSGVQEPPKEDENKSDSSGELTAVNESEEGSGEQQMVPLEESMQMTEQEARKMLQAIRDRDMLRRLRRQAAERSRRIPVERDW